MKNGPSRNYGPPGPGPFGATGPALINTSTAEYRGVKARVEIKDHADLPERYVDVTLTFSPSTWDGPNYTAVVRVPAAYQRPVPGHCQLCGRALDQPGIPESLDCGGDCRGCMDEIEKETPKP